MANTNYTAAFYGSKAAERISWITQADFSNVLNRELFPFWQANAITYTKAAATIARTTLREEGH